MPCRTWTVNNRHGTAEVRDASQQQRSIHGFPATQSKAAFKFGVLHTVQSFNPL